MMRKLLAVAALVFPSCYSAHTAAPARVSPYEYGVETRKGVPSGARAVSPYERGVEAEPASGSFGYATVGWQVVADYRGDLDISSGTGWRVSLPPLAALSMTWDAFWFLGLIAVASQGGTISGDVGELLIDLDAPEIWTSGLSDPRKLLSEVSWELTFEGSDHGTDDAFRLLTGLKVGTSRRWRARPYACGGWSWHWIWREEEKDLSVNGPYAGGGLDLFFNETSSVGLDGRWHWVYAEGYEETRLLTVELSWSLHW